MDALTLSPAPLHFPQRDGLNCGNGHRAQSGCPLRVINGPDGPEVRLPLYPRKRTQLGHRAMSEKCQTATLDVEAAQRKSRPKGAPSAIAGAIIALSSTVARK